MWTVAAESTCIFETRLCTFLNRRSTIPGKCCNILSKQKKKPVAQLSIQLTKSTLPSRVGLSLKWFQSNKLVQYQSQLVTGLTPSVGREWQQ
ncbi:hypothetical protein PR048_007787 [Dryococelus australis]|uniref:Uncharacterized protein n=1 Tax=Dryococelus australis TaxID=614101 RepID=A0ABQ9HV93_9NEOP|nr:hypothetical protein PR048_007787 [Dryococelus australis]